MAIVQILFATFLLAFITIPSWATHELPSTP